MVIYQSNSPSFSLQREKQQRENQYHTKQDRYEQEKFVGTFWNFLEPFEGELYVEGKEIKTH